MAKSNTFLISRLDLRRALIAFSVSDKNIETILAALDKAHKHMNVVAFAAMLEKAGLGRDKMANVFRRLGMDDIMINDVFNMVDEQRISAQTGRLYSATVDFS